MHNWFYSKPIAKRVCEQKYPTSGEIEFNIRETLSILNSTTIDHRGIARKRADKEYGE